MSPCRAWHQECLALLQAPRETFAHFLFLKQELLQRLIRGYALADMHSRSNQRHQLVSTTAVLPAAGQGSWPCRLGSSTVDIMWGELLPPSCPGAAAGVCHFPADNVEPHVVQAQGQIWPRVPRDGVSQQWPGVCQSCCLSAASRSEARHDSRTSALPACSCGMPTTHSTRTTP